MSIAIEKSHFVCKPDEWEQAFRQPIATTPLLVEKIWTSNNGCIRRISFLGMRSHGIRSSMELVCYTDDEQDRLHTYLSALGLQPRWELKSNAITGRISVTNNLKQMQMFCTVIQQLSELTLAQHLFIQQLPESLSWQKIERTYRHHMDLTSTNSRSSLTRSFKQSLDEINKNLEKKKSENSFDS